MQKRPKRSERTAPERVRSQVGGARGVNTRATEAPTEPREAPETATESAVEPTEPTPSEPVRDAQEGPEPRSSWWRRRFGG